MAVELETPDNRLLVCKSSQQAGSLLYFLLLQAQESPCAPTKHERQQRKDRRAHKGALTTAAKRGKEVRYIEQPRRVENKEQA